MKNTLRSSLSVLVLTAVTGVASAATVIIDTFTTNTTACSISGGFVGDSCSTASAAAEAQGGSRTLYAERALQNNSTNVSTDSTAGFYHAGTGPDAGGNFRITYTPVNADLSGGGTEVGFLFKYGADIAGSNMTVTITDGVSVSAFSAAVAATGGVVTDWFIPFALFSGGCATCTSADNIQIYFSNSQEAIDLSLDSITTYSGENNNNTPVPASVMLLGLGLLFLRKFMKKIL